MKHFSAIYLIDDDAVINFMNKKILQKDDVCNDILIFGNAEEALSEIMINRTAAGKKLILLDINMPIMDGWEFLDAFEKLGASITSDYHIVMLTSSISADDIEKSKTYKSVQGFISKPFTLEKLAGIAF